MRHLLLKNATWTEPLATDYKHCDSITTSVLDSKKVTFIHTSDQLSSSFHEMLDYIFNLPVITGHDGN